LRREGRRRGRGDEDERSADGKDYPALRVNQVIE